MDIFDQCYEIIVKKIEQLYSNNPQDAGGETVWGIARNRKPQWGGWSIVDQLRTQPGFPGTIKDHPEIEALAKEFYRNEFWNKLRCPDLPPRLAFLVFDEGVNEGTEEAARTLQKSVGATIDGDVGDHTVAAAVAKYSDWMLDHVCAVRAIGYTYDHDWPVFKDGWMNRVFEAHRFAMALTV